MRPGAKSVALLFRESGLEVFAWVELETCLTSNYSLLENIPETWVHPLASFQSLSYFLCSFFRMNHSFPLLENLQLSLIIYKRQTKILIWHSNKSTGC